jgi:hypothetical protein
MNTKIAKQKIIEVLGKNNNCAYPTTVCAVDVENTNRQIS